MLSKSFVVTYLLLAYNIIFFKKIVFNLFHRSRFLKISLKRDLKLEHSLLLSVQSEFCMAGLLIRL